MMSDSRKRILLGILLFAFIAGLFALYVNKPPNPDQGIFDYIGWVGLSGGKYYADVAEQNFPGEMILHEIAFLLFGVNIYAYRALDFLIAVTGALALWGLLKEGGSGKHSLWGAAFFLAGYVSSSAWMSGQRDIVAANLLLIVSYLFLLRVKGKSRLLLLPVGILLFFSLLLRPTYLLFAFALPLLDLFFRKRHGRSLGACLLDAGFVVIISLSSAALLLGIGAWTGVLQDFWEQVFLFNTQAYQTGHSSGTTLLRIASNLTAYLWYLPAALVAVLGAEREGRKGMPLLVLAGLAILSLLSAYVQNKGFGYHLGALIPPLFGLSGVAIALTVENVAKKRDKPWWRLGLSLSASLLALLGLMFQAKSLGPQIRYVLGIENRLQMMGRENGGEEGHRWADSYAAADYARSATGEDETVLVWGRPVSINLLARRRSPSRFITHGMLLLARPPFERSEAWIQEFEEALRENPPKVVFVSTTEGEALDAEGDGLEGGKTATMVLSAAIAAGYDYVRDFGSMAAYLRRD